jgi:hypothetical protein
VQVFGIATDTQEQLSDFRIALDLPFTMLSDPLLSSAKVFDIPVSSKTSYATSLPLHPVLRHLPKRAFLQPAFFLWRGQEQLYAWRQTEKLRNLFGANGRPSPQDIFDITKRLITG